MDNRPTIAEVQEWVLRLYNTCEQTITDEERKSSINMLLWCNVRKTRSFW
mgnify:CR=1 FL=1